MVWGPNGYMATWGVKDFAGGIVVHISSGFSALASLAVLGKRPELSCHEIDISQISFQNSMSKNEFQDRGARRFTFARTQATQRILRIEIS